ncbi:hypothetical protein RHI63_10940 [Thermosynechococcus sp. GLH187]|uniref:hypothetical protein n=1 Tax=unclassified Thermosynechococcus TaxID=2622553 RepID=UPI00197EA66B|nr:MULTISPECIES: hypothetical protein [unclassified Thermosynechococcus]MDR5639964.1 hypothetical protein [Thermosynechococcus sp. PP42]MDR7921981.1 hypothetical protein [Thermosynechococcus sp. HY213]MDR7992892.1 hypothetical protein [Thermosynechococcus sp. TG252]QSF48829.1 hypothetical protein JW907_10905 [Thermosynechococcus sp. TA-1]WNC29565.1 hypothetical protein RHH53_10970 [Thermosynechococcus sp. PKX82]
MLNLRRTALVALAAMATCTTVLLSPAEAKQVKAVRGVVTNIDGDNVTLRQPWGEEIVVVFDRKHRQRPFRKEIVEGLDVAVILDPKASVPTAKIICAAIVPAPEYVAVTPIRVPQVGGSAPAPRPAAIPPAAPAPAPPTQILF